MTTLQNKVVQLKNIMSCYIKKYSDTLFEAKESKIQAALNRVSNHFFLKLFLFIFSISINKYNFNSLLMIVMYQIYMMNY